MYYLYSGRMSGWFTCAGTYTSDIADAATFPQADAFAMCRRHKNQAAYQLLPIRVEDMEALA